MSKFRRIQKIKEQLVSEWDVIKDTVKLSKSSRLGLIASSLAFSTVFSIIPLLAVSFAIFKAFGGLNKIVSTLEPFILENLTQGSSDSTLSTIHSFIDNVHTGTIGATGLLILIVTCMSMFSSVENAINSVWKTEVTRPIFQRMAYYWFIITLGPVALAIFLGATTSGTVKWTFWSPGHFHPPVAAFLLLFVIYKWVPQRKVNTLAALKSAICVAFLWSFAKMGYGIYIRNLASYNKIYGSLGAVPIFLLWVYITWLIVLNGAALTAVLQYKRERKNTKESRSS